MAGQIFMRVDEVAEELGVRSDCTPPVGRMTPCERCFA